MSKSSEKDYEMLVCGDSDDAEALSGLTPKEIWILEHMKIANVGREKAEKKYKSMKRHGLAP